jgi:hypothetical protein
MGPAATRSRSRARWSLSEASEWLRTVYLAGALLNMFSSTHSYSSLLICPKTGLHCPVSRHLLTRFKRSAKRNGNQVVQEDVDGAVSCEVFRKTEKSICRNQPTPIQGLVCDDNLSSRERRSRVLKRRQRRRFQCLLHNLRNQ